MTDRTSPELALKRAESLGIPASVLSKWIPDKQVPSKTSASNPSNIFQLDGPIVSDTVWAVYDEPAAGLVAPARMRNFLDECAGDDIVIEINSPGGNVWDANAMRSALLRYEGKVDVIVTGVCASAANIFLTLPKTDRLSMTGTEFMIHNVFAMALGDYRELYKVAANLEKSSDDMAARLSKASNLDKSTVAAMMDEETWFDEKQALTYGFVDQVYDEDGEGEEEAGAPDEKALVDDIAIKRAERIHRTIFQTS